MAQNSLGLIGKNGFNIKIDKNVISNNEGQTYITLLTYLSQLINNIRSNNPQFSNINLNTKATMDSIIRLTDCLNILDENCLNNINKYSEEIDEMIKISNTIPEASDFKLYINMFINLSMIFYNRIQETLKNYSEIISEFDFYGLDKDNFIRLYIQDMKDNIEIGMASTSFACMALYDFVSNSPAVAQGDALTFTREINLYMTIIFENKTLQIWKKISSLKNKIPNDTYTLLEESFNIQKKTPFLSKTDNILYTDSFYVFHYLYSLNPELNKEYLQLPRGYQLKSKYLVKPSIAGQIIINLYTFIILNPGRFQKFLTYIKQKKLKEEFFPVYNKISQLPAGFKKDTFQEYITANNGLNLNILPWNQFYEKKYNTSKCVFEKAFSNINDPYQIKDERNPSNEDICYIVKYRLLFRRFFVSLFPLSESSILILTSILGLDDSLELFNSLSSKINAIFNIFIPSSGPVGYEKCKQLDNPAESILKLIQSHFYFVLPPWDELYG